MKSLMDVIKDYIKAEGCDGLYNPDAECGCGLDDFAPCGDLELDMCILAKSKIVTEETVGQYGFPLAPGDVVYMPVRCDSSEFKILDDMRNELIEKYK